MRDLYVGHTEFHVSNQVELTSPVMTETSFSQCVTGPVP